MRRKIGLLGNKKLDDGNMCKDCAKKLSPFFSDRRKSSLSDIKSQLEYREANKADVSDFNVTRTLGNGYMKIYFDEERRNFIVTSSTRWRNENPDVIKFSQVTGCNTEIKESRIELKAKDKDGKEVSFNPPRYDIDYDFYITIFVNSPWFNEIQLKLNDYKIDQRTSIEYREAERIANEIRTALTEVRQEVRNAIAEENIPKIAKECPWCGATTTPDANGKCEYCGGAMLQ